MKVKNLTNFYINFLVKPLYIEFSIFCFLALLTSYLSTFDNVFLFNLFTSTNYLKYINIILLLSFSNLSTCLIKYLKNRIYEITIKFFWYNVCLKNLYFWDKYDKTEILKCINNDIKEFSSVSARVLNIFFQRIICVIIVSILLIKESWYYFYFGLILCFLRSYLLEKISVFWEQKYNDVKSVSNSLEDKLIEYSKNFLDVKMYQLDNKYNEYVTSSLSDFYSKQVIESKYYLVFMMYFSILTKLISIGLFFIMTLLTTNNTDFYKGQVLISYIIVFTESIQSLSDIPKHIKNSKEEFKRLNKYICTDILLKYSTQPVDNFDIVFIVT